jgi:CoA:oxalate CoA-transferase
MMLADLGAEVIRVEPPWGAMDRLADGGIIGGSSFTFHHLNLNKKSLTLNLKEPKGLNIFKKLVKISDVLVQNFRPGTMERLGLGYEVLKELNPGIIYAALSGFGISGPYSRRKSYAVIAEAMSGHTRLTGDILDPHGPPVEMAQSYGDLGPGTMAAMAILAAIRYRDKTGIGQMIEVAQLDCMMAYNTAITGYLVFGLSLSEIRKRFSFGHSVGGLLKTRDGWIRLAIFEPRGLDKIKEVMGVEEVTKELLEEKTQKMSRDEAVTFFIDNDLACAPVYDVGEVVKDPHVAYRKILIELDHPTAGNIKVPNFPIKFSKIHCGAKTPAPVLGQHSKEVLMDLLAFSHEQVDELIKEGTTTSP